MPDSRLYIIEPVVHGDSRGYFMETYNQNDMNEAGLEMIFVQDNQSMSTKGFSVVCTFKNSIHRVSWYVSLRAACLM